MPTLIKLMVFRMGRTKIRLELDDSSRDYTYYADKGWLESDYYYPTRLGVLKKGAGKLFDSMSASLSAPGKGIVAGHSSVPHTLPLQSSQQQGWAWRTHSGRRVSSAAVLNGDCSKKLTNSPTIPARRIRPEQQVDGPGDPTGDLERQVVQAVQHHRHKSGEEIELETPRLRGLQPPEEQVGDQPGEQDRSASTYWSCKTVIMAPFTPTIRVIAPNGSLPDRARNSTTPISSPD